MTEEWRFAGRGPYSVYEVSSLGRVRSLGLFRKDPRILKGTLQRGYRTVYMHPRTAVKVHQLVAQAFLPPRPSAAHQINHIDGDRGNNRVDNLEWVTHAENMRHSRDVLGNKPPHGERAGAARLTEINVREIREMRRIGLPVKAIAGHFRVHQQTVRACLRGKTWRHVPRQ